MTINLSDLTKISDGLPDIGTKCLVYSTQGGYTVAKYTDKIGTVGKYKEAWFCKSGRQMSRKTIVGWVGLEEE